MPERKENLKCPTAGHFEKEFQKYKELTKISIQSYLNSIEDDNPMFSSLKYTLSTEGKLFRPVFSLSVGDYLGLELNSLSNITLLLELIHVSSLIHDDLPSLDNDDLRRGKPSCHKVYGEGHSILLGDYLISEAYNLISHWIPNSEHAKKLNSALCKAFSDLCIGQVLDLELRGKQLNQNQALLELERINALKTGALFELSVEIPLIISEAEDSVAKVIKEYARNLGLIFQLSDDILDVSGDTKTGKDKEINYIDVLGIEGTEARAESLVRSTIEILSSLPDSGSGFMQECIYFARGRKA